MSGPRKLVCRWNTPRTNVYRLEGHNLDADTEAGGRVAHTFLLAQEGQHDGSFVGCSACEELIQEHIRSQSMPIRVPTLAANIFGEAMPVGYELADGYRHTYG